MSNPNQEHSSSAFLPAVLAAWLAYLAVDFLTHAVLLAAWWTANAASFLPPAELFRRIPFAYLSFLIYSGLLVWLLQRLLGARPAVGASLRLAAWAGLAFGIVTTLGNYSVFSVPPSTLIVWPVSMLAGSLAAGAAASSVLNAPGPWRRLLLVFLAALGVLILGVLLQNI
jgi:hypothetical protein